MPPLDDYDLDRISDKVALAIKREIHDAMKEHVVDLHDPVQKQLDSLQTKVLLASGGFAVAMWVLTQALK